MAAVRTIDKPAPHADGAGSTRPCRTRRVRSGIGTGLSAARLTWTWTKWPWAAMASSSAANRPIRVADTGGVAPGDADPDINQVRTGGRLEIPALRFDHEADHGAVVNAKQG